MVPSPGDATALLQAACGGSSKAEDELFPRLFTRGSGRVAGSLMRSERPGSHARDPPALVHEAWMNLVDQDAIQGVPTEEARRRFVGLAAHAMRRVLIDHARRGIQHQARWRVPTRDDLRRSSLAGGSTRRLCSTSSRDW